MCESLCSKEMLNNCTTSYKQIGENKQIGEKLAAFVGLHRCVSQSLVSQSHFKKAMPPNYLPLYKTLQ